MSEKWCDIACAAGAAGFLGLVIWYLMSEEINGHSVTIAALFK